MNYPNPHGPSCPWYSITETQGAPNIKWCEETLCQWISEPANTWSNLGYMLVALYIIWYGRKHNHSSQLKQFGPIIFFMGAMSFFYHQSNFYGSQVLDFVGMFFFVGWCIGMNLIRLGRMKTGTLIPFNLAYGLFFTAVMHYMYLNGVKFQLLIIISAFIIIATEVMASKSKEVKLSWFVSTLSILALAFTFSFLDGSRTWCHPENHGWFSQGHALWHWTAAIAMYTIYRHYSQPALSKN